MTLSRRQQVANAWARYVQKPTLGFTPNQKLLNGIFHATSAHLRTVPGTRQSRATPGGIDTRVIEGAGQSPNLLIYLHGGGFSIGGPFTVRGMASRLGQAAGCTTWLPRYRLASAASYPAAPDDCFAVYRAALDTHAPDRIVLAGDSAGGCLVLNTLTRAADHGLPMPAAVGLIAPVVDLRPDNPARAAFPHGDGLLPARWLRRSIPMYLGGHDPADPGLSPIFADLSKAPPALVQVGDTELLRDDAERLVQHMPNARLDVWEGVPHVWHMNAGLVPEATRAVQDMGAFLRGHLPP
ncbi:alpha/beta hydrolase [Pseudaestuariivita atlantica]|uniref:alpha/beta hydrolase n=1 Tax=Pseudaestuariivita atlantica TaxID=1317121 RepID=UPI00067C706E|nr:alpha/beta hydrolase [Pseudaestuariivita atlantica]